jgi:hypothetical protein
MTLKSALVITSISAPNPALIACAKGSRKHDTDFIVIGDTKSPVDFSLDGCDFWSIQRQRDLPLRLVSLLPERHYARKNIGYLIAIQRGAEVIIETDDDNFPRETFWRDRYRMQTAILYEDIGWVNVYKFFTDQLVWPRGFPLELIKRPMPPAGPRISQELHCPIQQGLADDNPDVDAVYRLTMTLPLRFSRAPAVALGAGCWTPFNSQNTTWFKEAFPLLYIPSFCSFRMCDIWRSFVALRICWANDWKVLFHGPTVYQERNAHNLLSDFSDELPGYMNNAKICDELAFLDIKGGSSHTGDNLRKCYQTFIRNRWIDEKELRLIDAWIADVDKTLAES